ncbi:MAG: transketolase [Candidatus Aenigmarchaeota archaeon]|nr:transketolase [Candidatus Aenigmarchaeota archaeon]
MQERARKIRKNVVKMIARAGSGHPGGSLSIVDILCVLYFNEMRYDPKNPSWKARDRLILSKGHAAPALYATLAEAGFFPEQELLTLRKIGSRCQGHTTRMLPGVEVCSGSLGQGLSIANGMALSAKLDDIGSRIYAIVGDGESQEGQIWEAAMAAAHYRLDNITVFLDRNGLQIDGETEKIMALEPIADKWRSFGWHVVEIDGHNFDQIKSAIRESKIAKKPTLIIAHTIKGKGVSFMENAVEFHGKAPTLEEAEKAMMELEQ